MKKRSVCVKDLILIYDPLSPFFWSWVYGLRCQDENRSELTHPELPSEDSMLVHPSSFMEQETQSTSLHTQVLVDTHTHIVRIRNGTGDYTLLDSKFLLPLSAKLAGAAD